MSTRVLSRGTPLLFIGLSFADLYFTWQLLGHGHGVYEGNPVARWWLDRLGWGGLAAFKLGTVVLFLGLAATICRHRPRTGRRVLTFGCTAVAAVMLYSCALPRLHGLQAVAAADEQVRVEQERLDRELAQLQAYQALWQRLCTDLEAGRCTLAGAVDELWRSGYWEDPFRSRALGSIYPGYSLLQCVAASLVEYAVDSLHGRPDTAERLARRLEADFLAQHGRPLVWHRILRPPSGAKLPTRPQPGRTSSSPGNCIF